MEPKENWEKIRQARKQLPEKAWRSLCRELYAGRESCLAAQLQLRREQSLILEVLAALATPQAEEVLLRCLEDREEALELAAAEALKRAAPARLIEPLARIMARQGPGAAKAGEVLAALGPQGRERLWQLWFEEGASASLKAQVLLLLSEQDDPRCESLTFLALLSREEELAGAGLKAAVIGDFKELWGNAACCLSSGSWHLRARAFETLAKLGVKEALTVIEEAGPDPEPWAEEERRQAIRKLSEE